MSRIESLTMTNFKIPPSTMATLRKQDFIGSRKVYLVHHGSVWGTHEFRPVIVDVRHHDLHRDVDPPPCIRVKVLAYEGEFLDGFRRILPHYIKVCQFTE